MCNRLHYEGICLIIN